MERIRQNVFPVLAAFIWGTAFVAQSVGAEYLEPFTFNAARSIIAALALTVVVWAFRRKAPEAREPQTPGSRRMLVIGGVCCGTALAVAANFQQVGIGGTSAGKASFITALYIVLVPICGLFFHKRVRPLVWFSVAVAVAGLYCICVKEGFSITTGDFFVLICAFCFTVHILVIDYFTQRTDGIALSCIQFYVAAAWSALGMLFFESPSWEGLMACLPQVLYVGVFSSAVGYTLQILAQKGSNPTVVSLLLSLESVFGALAGAVILGERMSGKEYFGCVLMLVAVVLAQLPERSRAPRTSTEKC